MATRSLLPRLVLCCSFVSYILLATSVAGLYQAREIVRALVETGEEMDTHVIVALTKLARVSGPVQLPLREALDRARLAASSEKEIQKLCVEAADRILALKNDVRQLTERLERR